MKWGTWLAPILALFLMAGQPSSTNYVLQSYGIGSGSTAGSSSTNYSANGILGEQSGSSSSTNYSAGSGYNATLQANEPTVTLSNPTLSYNTLVVTISPDPDDATDTKYAVEISSDNFATVDYVDDDFGTGPTESASDFMTYSTWGGSGGQTIAGLAYNTVYEARASAMHGNFTQSQWGPASSAATTNTPSITFSIAVSPTYQVSSTPPYDVDFGNLLAGSVTTAPDKIWMTVSCNGEDGMSLFGGGLNGGLVSASSGHTISSSSGDLSSQSEGFGEQDSLATQSSGGPMTEMSPYNVSGSNVGEDYTDLDEMFSTDDPVGTGEAGVSLLAKTSLLTPVASDYSETLTLVAAGGF